MVTPQSYQFTVQDPFAAATKGFNFVQGIRQAQMQKEALKQQAEQQKLLQEKLNGLMQTPSNQRTAQDYADLSMLMPKEQAESMRKSWDLIGADKQASYKQRLMAPLAAIRSNNPAIAQSLFEQYAAAEENSGNAEQAQAYRTAAKIVELNPESAGMYVGSLLANAPGGKEAIDAIEALATGQREERMQPIEEGKGMAAIAKTEAETAKVEAETGAVPAEIELKEAQAREVDAKINDMTRRYDLDVEKLEVEKDRIRQNINVKRQELLQTGVKLSAGSEKAVNEAVLKSTESTETASRYRALADEMAASGAVDGWGSGTLENVKRFFGAQDAYTALQEEYDRMSKSAIMASLPKGPASDRDIEFAKSGVPKPNAPVAHKVRYLRGMAKINDIAARASDAQAGWISANGNLGNARTDMNVNGVMVRAGTPFSAYYKTVMKGKGAAAPTRGYLNKY